ncbi:MAG: glycosyltransferase family 2 protein [Flavobacteriaceae bacterium]|nr:glycosyltransferase family 2 protein [Bacteroidia bacterium]MBT8287211.1 glycosyltransferase family 2 protein [Bacteroidia bacterium]NNF75569.1 glycosyltransferase family 2 protein [Flavobacteriaceae bacterium]NNK74376.1 glycosyltransferase family 2 protein [Flavobacteriaceae bacterium]
MKVYIVIPAHNEEHVLKQCLDSLVAQSVKPEHLVLVNDNSSDETRNIMLDYVKSYDWISMIDLTSSSEHLPGSKVVNAFYKGFDSLDQDFDIICKFDADIVFPPEYISKLIKMFAEDSELGIAGGLPFTEKNGEWVFEAIASQNHVRGPVKAYRKDCFEAIGGLKPTIGWDTLDVLLAQYHGWNVSTDKNLHVRHLKPTGKAYNKAARFLQGKAFYGMRYGFILTVIAALKGGWVRNQPFFTINAIWGFLRSWINRDAFLVTSDQGRFIRKLRWIGIKKKLI